jgi:hypothetical protein
VGVSSVDSRMFAAVTTQETRDGGSYFHCRIMKSRRSRKHIHWSADKSLTFPISYLQDNEKNFSWVVLKKLEQRSHKCVEVRREYVQ